MTFFTSISERKKSWEISVLILGFVSLGLMIFATVAYVSNAESRALRFFQGNSFYGNANNPLRDFSNTRVAIVGSSQGVAINTLAFTPPAAEFLSPYQNLTETALTLKHLSARAPDLDLILIPVTLGTFRLQTGIQSPLVQARFVDELENQAPPGIFNLLDIFLNDSLKAWRTLPNVGKLALTDFLEEEHNTEPHNPFDPDQVRTEVGYAVDSLAKDSWADNLSKLEEIKTIADSLNACLILFETPVSSSYRQTLQQLEPELVGWKNELKAAIEDSTTQTCLYFVDDIWPQEHGTNPDYYDDGGHLSDAGAAIFTQLLQQHLCHSVSPGSFVSRHSDCS